MRVNRGVTLVLSVGLLASCNGGRESTRVPPGTALQAPAGRDWRVLGKVPPEYEWILMSAFLWNRSPEPIRLSEVTLAGSYIRSVEVVRTQIAVIPGTHHRRAPHENSPDVVPGGLYETYPPAYEEEGARCHVQEVSPVRGYVLGPDEEARVLVWLRAASPGRFRIDGHLVRYEQSGQRFQQFIGVGVRGTVRRDGSRDVLEDPLEEACAGAEGVKNLNPA